MTAGRYFKMSDTKRKWLQVPLGIFEKALLTWAQTRLEMPPWLRLPIRADKRIQWVFAPIQFSHSQWETLKFLPIELLQFPKERDRDAKEKQAEPPCQPGEMPSAARKLVPAGAARPRWTHGPSTLRFPVIRYFKGQRENMKRTQILRTNPPSAHLCLTWGKSAHWDLLWFETQVLLPAHFGEFWQEIETPADVVDLPTPALLHHRPCAAHTSTINKDHGSQMQRWKVCFRGKSP